MAASIARFRPTLLFFNNGGISLVVLLRLLADLYVTPRQWRDARSALDRRSPRSSTRV